MWIAVAAAGGFLVGLFFMDFIIVRRMTKKMLFEDRSPYSVDETVEDIVMKSQESGWSVPKIHDLQETMRKNGFEVKPVKVIEMCKPGLAKRILGSGEERIVSSLMPCRMAVYEKQDGKTYVSRLNSRMLSRMLGGLIYEVMSDASRESEELIAPIIGENS